MKKNIWKILILLTFYSTSLLARYQEYDYDMDFSGGKVVKGFLLLFIFIPATFYLVMEIWNKLFSKEENFKDKLKELASMVVTLLVVLFLMRSCI